MKNYWYYWRQGWRLVLVLLIILTFLVLGIVPIGIALNLDLFGYLIAFIPLFLFVVVPLGGYLFCALKPTLKPEK